MSLEIYNRPSQFVQGLSATTFYSSSAIVDVIDIREREIDGLNIFGNVNIVSAGLTVGTDISARGQLTVLGNISASNVSFNDAYVSTISALSATFTVLDVQGFEVEGFTTNGNLNVSGNGNFAQNINVLSAVNTLNLVGGSNNNTTNATSPYFVFGSNNQLQSGTSNSFIIGNNVIAGASNYLYVNNLSATGNVETLGDIITRNVNDVRIGLGGGQRQSNIAIGVSALGSNTQGVANIALGRGAMLNAGTGISRISLTFSGSGYATAPDVQASGGNPIKPASLQALLSASYFLTISSVANGYKLSALSANPNYAEPFQAISAVQYVVSEVLVLDRGIGYSTLIPTIVFSGGTAVTYVTDDGDPQTISIRLPQANALSATAINNIAIGHMAGFDLSTGSDNILLGLSAGQDIASGNKNIVIGNYNYLDKNSDDNTIIGYNNDTNGYENLIILGNNLSATKSNFAFISALDVKQLTVNNGSFGDNLIVQDGVLSATSLLAASMTALSADIKNFQGSIGVNQISPSNALDGQAILFNDGIWYPGNVIGEFPGTRLHDFQLTSYDANFQTITADTSYCGVAPSGYRVNDQAWRITRLKYNDGGSVYEQGITVNVAWSARYDSVYILF